MLFKKFNILFNFLKKMYDTGKTIKSRILRSKIFICIVYNIRNRELSFFKIQYQYVTRYKSIGNIFRYYNFYKYQLACIDL